MIRARAEWDAERAALIANHESDLSGLIAHTAKLQDELDEWYAADQAWTQDEHERAEDHDTRGPRTPGADATSGLRTTGAEEDVPGFGRRVSTPATERASGSNTRSSPGSHE